MLLFWEVLTIEHMSSSWRYNWMAISIINWTFLSFHYMTMMRFWSRLLLVISCICTELSEEILGRRGCFIWIYGLICCLDIIWLCLTGLFVRVWSLFIEICLVNWFYCWFCFLFGRFHHFIWRRSSEIFFSFYILLWLFIFLGRFEILGWLWMIIVFIDLRFFFRYRLQITFK